MRMSWVKTWLLPGLAGALTGLALGPIAAFGIPIALGILMFARPHWWKVFAMGMLIVMFPFGVIFPAGLSLFGQGFGSGGVGGPSQPQDDSFLGDLGDLFDVPGYDNIDYSTDPEIVFEPLDGLEPAPPPPYYPPGTGM